MIKRLIFDIDDTLIIWKKEYDNAINKTLDDLQYPYTKDFPTQINNLELEYEIDRRYFSKKEMLEFINNGLSKKIPSNFIDTWLENLKNCVEENYPEEDYKILEKLSKKYELVILTNWFKESQIERLRKLDILKFFKKIYDAEKYAKPYKESFIKACGNYSLDEVAIIGDNFEKDILGAKRAGIQKLIWRDNKNKKQEYENLLNGIEIITNLEELEKIFL